MVNHLEAMDKTLFFGVPSDKLSNGVFNYSAAGYKYFVEKYGVITTIPTGTALTADAVDQWACDMAERDVDADCVYMSPKTWKCLKKAFKN